MKRTASVISILLGLCLFLSFSQKSVRVDNSPLKADSLTDARKRSVDAVLSTLNGRENSYADSVFSNIKTFKDSQRLHVKHFLAVMNYWGEALGVGCNYCHTKDSWASDSLRTKRIARQMYDMRSVINTQLLSKMHDLDPKSAEVNCSTCHRGHPLAKE